jgi:CheY-like chemotaxis protein
MGTMSRLLLVEDDHVVARAVARVLGRHHHSVEVCHRALDAIERVRAERWDLVITDFRMPDLDGLTLASRIVAEAPGTPIILMTGSFDVDLERVTAAGVVAVMPKPVEPEVLVEHVRLHARPPFLEPRERG